MIDASEIVHNLYVGGWSAARDYGQEFDVIVNCASDAPDYGGLHFNLIDGPGNDNAEFLAAVNAVYENFNSGKRVLVHCVAGMSRSVCVTAAALARLSVPDALAFVRVKRGCDDARPKCPHDAMITLYNEYTQSIS